MYNDITNCPPNTAVENIEVGTKIATYLKKRTGQVGQFKVVLAGVDSAGQPTMRDITSPVAARLSYRYNDKTETLSYNQYGADIVENLSRELFGEANKLVHIRL